MTTEDKRREGWPRVALRPVSITEALIDALRKAVLDGALPAGAPIAEVEIAELYGVSRPTARAAITALVHSGLLVRQANRSALVPVLTSQDVEDLFFVRVPLEVRLVTALIERRLQPEDAASAISRLAAVPREAPHSRFVEADLGFHRALVTGLASPRLSRIFSELEGEIHLSMIQTRSALGQARIVAEHGAILDAIREEDREKAARLMTEHLEGAREVLVKVLRETEHPAEAN